LNVPQLTFILANTLRFECALEIFTNEARAGILEVWGRKLHLLLWPQKFFRNEAKVSFKFLIILEISNNCILTEEIQRFLRNRSHKTTDI
jgi:hypothetical protein